MQGRRHSFQRLAASLLVALMLGAGVAAAGHAWFNGTYYCGIGGTASPNPVAEGTTVTHRVTVCHKFTGYTSAASWIGGIRVSAREEIHLNNGATGTITLAFNAGGPGNKDVYGYAVASHATPGPSLYNAWDHIALTVVGNPSTPGVGEDHNPAGWSTHNHPHWTWGASAAYGSITQYQVDPTWGGAFTTGATDYHPTLGSGAHAIRVRAMNNVGVWGPWSGYVYAYVDTTVPTTALNLAGTAGANGWWRSSVQATLSASDGHSGVASTSKALDGAAFSAYTGPISIGGEGGHTLRYFSRDNVGNQEATRTAGVNIDTVAPSTGIGIGAPSLVQQGTTFLTSAARVTLSPSDATSGVASTTANAGAGAFAYAGPFGLGGADGPRTLTFGSTDVAGNAEATQSRALFLDNTPPLSQMSAGSPSVPDAAGTFVTSVTPVSVGASDAGVGVGASFHRVAGGPWLQGSPFRLPGPDGRYGVDAYAQDKLGNTEAPPKSAAFQVDNTAPTLAFTAPAPDTLTALGQTIAIPLPDCGASGAPCAAPLLSKANRPAIVLGGSVVQLRSDASDPIVNGVASGMASVRYELDGVLLGEATSAPWTVNWDTRATPGGPHNLTATARDRLGNAATVGRSVVVLVATVDGLAATPPYLLSLVGQPGIPGVPNLPPVTPPGIPTLPPVGPPAVPNVRPVFSAVIDPNNRSLSYKVGLEVNGQFIGDERTIDL